MSWVVPQLSLLQAFNCHHFTTVSSDFIFLPGLGLIKLCHQTGTVIILNKLVLSSFVMQQPCTVDNLALWTVYQATTVCQPCINSNCACLMPHTQTMYYLELSVECFKLCHPQTVYIYILARTERQVTTRTVSLQTSNLDKHADLDFGSILWKTLNQRPKTWTVFVA